MTTQLPSEPTDLRADAPDRAVPAPRRAADDAVLAPAPAAADLAELRRSVRGPVLVAGDDGLADEVAAWNLAVRHTPWVAVGATCAADVVAAVTWAVAHGLGVAVQSTGHGPVRSAAGALLITTHRMQGVAIDPDRRVARVQAGVTWARVMPAAAEYGLAGLCGSSSGVGVVGYTLGGGTGSFGRQHGFAADHVVAVEIVTADGRLRRVTAESEPELFWALRGGKGNFGIVTALEFQLFPVPSLFGGGLFFAGEDAAVVLHRFREWAPTMPEQVSTSVAILRIPDTEELPPPLRGQTVVHLRFAYTGEDHAEAERLLSPMRTAGTIVLGYVGPMRTDEMDGIHMDPVDPMPGWEKGMLLAELPAEAVDALLEAAGPRVHIPLILVELRLMGGALARPAAVPNAVAGRGGALSMFAVGPLVPELADVVPAVGKGVLAALMPWCAPGVLTNFLGDVTGPAEVLNSWPTEIQRRLVEVKRAVDPDGVFTFGHAF